VPELFSAQTIRFIFSNMEEIVQVHQRMSKRIAKEISTKQREEILADIFERAANEMQIYAQVGSALCLLCFL